MSAIELLRSRIEQSAKAAADTARQISSLDDMAQKDHYVQSEGLKVSAKQEQTSTVSSFSNNSVIEDLSGRFVDALSTAARKQNRPPSSTNKSHDLAWQSTLAKTDCDKKSATEWKQHPASAARQLMPSVAVLYDQNNNQKNAAAKEQGGISLIPKKPLVPSNGTKTNMLLVSERHAKILHELDYDSETDSSDDEDTRKSKNNNPGSDLDLEMIEQELEESISRQNSLKNPVCVGEQKDVYRFMKITADLESEREVLLKSLVDLESPTPTNNRLWTKEAHGGAVAEKPSKTLLSWVRSVATPQLEALSRQIMTKVSEADDTSKKSRPKSSRGPMIGSRNIQSCTRNNTDVDKITMRTSASCLADDDMAELERIRTKNSSSKIVFLITTCIDNPRFVFIAATLIFALAAYFYSRHKSVDDVL